VERGSKEAEGIVREKRQSQKVVKSQKGLGLPGSAEMLWHAVGSVLKLAELGEYCLGNGISLCIGYFILEFGSSDLVNRLFYCL
jgi:hypothetical protein